MNEEKDPLLDYFKGDELAANVWRSKYAQDGDITPDEIWKNIPNSNYAISNKGRVMNIGTLTKKDSRGRLGKRRPKILKNRKSKNGYYITFKNMLVHRLVAQLFINNINNYLEVNHIDGNKLNNLYNNLEWCNRSQNIKHSYNNNLRIKNPHESSKLIKSQIDEIRNMYNTGNYTQKTLGYLFKVRQQSISKIINLIQWK